MDEWVGGWVSGLVCGWVSGLVCGWVIGCVGGWPWVVELMSRWVG